jgi:hypothetical protein
MRDLSFGDPGQKPEVRSGVSPLLGEQELCAGEGYQVDRLGVSAYWLLATPMLG